MTGDTTSFGANTASDYDAHHDQIANSFPRAASETGSEDYIVDEKKRQAQKSWRELINRHLKRFWLWYLIAAIVLAAILLPLLFKVIIPAIVQDIINKQGLIVDHAGLIPVTPTTVLASLYSKLKIPINIPISIDETVIHLYNKDSPQYSPFINATLPAQQFKGMADIAVVNQSVPIANYSEALKWLGQAFDQDEVDISARAQLSAHIGALHYTPMIDKTVTLPGLRRLQGLQIGSLNLNLQAAKNTTNAEGSLVLPNWSGIDLFLGNMTIDLLSGKLKLGYVTLKDVTLPHQTNTTCAFTGFLDLSTAINNIGAILVTQAPYLKDGNLELTGQATSVVINGQHIKIVEELLAPRPLPVPVSVVSLLMDVIGGIIPGGNATDILGNVGSVFGNQTLIEDALNRMNKTHTQAQQSQNSINGTKGKRDADNLMWQTLKVFMKMKQYY